MEKRVITTVNENTHQKKVFMSEAETLGQLKADFAANGVEYEGFVLFEGNTGHSIDGNDNTLLPRDVTKINTTETTNNLMIFLCNDKKKIKSGADRKELYNKIVAFGLKDKCYAEFDKNYTNCSSKVLEALIKEWEDTHTANADVKNSNLIDAFIYLVTTLFKKDAITETEYSKLIDYLNGTTTKEVECPYSDDEIEAMLNRL